MVVMSVGARIENTCAKRFISARRSFRLKSRTDKKERRLGVSGKEDTDMKPFQAVTMLATTTSLDQNGEGVISEDPSRQRHHVDRGSRKLND